MKIDVTYWTLDEIFGVVKAIGRSKNDFYLEAKYYPETQEYVTTLSF